MSYVTPVTDRSQADIVAKNSKAFFNVTDWERIYNNARLAIDLARIIGGLSVGWDDIYQQYITYIPNVTHFNTLLENIELARQAVNIPTAATVIKYDWEAGSRKQAPKYTHVNQWEKTINAIWTYYNGGSIPVCPVLSSNLTVLTGNYALYIDCLDMADYNIDLQGTAKLYII